MTHSTPTPRNGFLPITTNTFDRYFISVVCFIAIHLLWLRFVEPMGLALWMATVLSVMLGFVIVKWG